MMPLDNIRVLDFSTLLPGPMATLALAEAGAEVIKIERPGGEEMRSQPPFHGDTGLLFALLNRGKRSVEIDLKKAGAVDRLMPLIESAQVLVEQFRPGVMARLGLGWEVVHALNPRLVYCSITGYGQTGPKASEAGHDLNYMAETGLLSITRGTDGAPVLPQTQLADIGAGTLPAVINILLALRESERSGIGCHLDVAMTDNLFPFLWAPLGIGQATGEWTKGADMPLTGASPRYNIYKTADGAYLSVGALEQKFWNSFCDAIALDPGLRDDSRDAGATIAGVRTKIASQPAEAWRRRFEGLDACAVLMSSLEEARADPHHRARGLFDRMLTGAEPATMALPSPLAPVYRDRMMDAACPSLGDAQHLLDEA